MPLESSWFMGLNVALLIAAAGCKDTEPCAKARNGASDAWKGVNAMAAKNKIAPSIGLDEMPPERKVDHIAAWGSIEKQAEMIQSSFAYEMITWKTADPARAKANAAFAGYFAKDEFKTFRVALDDANVRYEEASKACRD